MKLIRRCEGNYISEDGTYVIFKSEWARVWFLYENGLKVGGYLTKKEAKAEAERRETERSAQ